MRCLTSSLTLGSRTAWASSLMASLALPCRLAPAKLLWGTGNASLYVCHVAAALESHIAGAASMCCPLFTSCYCLCKQPLAPVLSGACTWQVEFLRLLYDRMVDIHNKTVGTPQEWRFPRPSFKVGFLLGPC